MKNLKLLSLFIVAMAMLQACNNPEGERTETGEAQEVKESEGNIYKVDSDASTVEWLGTKPGGKHWGNVPVSEGKIKIKDGEITGGEFVMDMKKLKVDDPQDPKPKERLRKHLKSPDFFAVDSFPTSKFEITKVAKLDGETTDDGMELTHKISGNLTMRGNTRNVSFRAQVNILEDRIEAKTPQFLIDRTRWDVNFGSKSVFGDAVNTVIHDDIGITIKLKAEKQDQ